MSAPIRLLFKDIWDRGSRILGALCVLQLLFAIGFLRADLQGLQAFALPIMILCILPFAAPSRRVLITLPMSRVEMDRVQWLYGGGLVALGAAASSALAWLITLVSSSPPPLWRVALLLLGTPGAIGMSMLLRRWTMGAVHPNNQARPVVLPMLLGTFLMMGALALPRDSLTMVLPVAFVVSCGWAALLVFFFSPPTYYGWIERTHTALRRPKRGLAVWAARGWIGIILRSLASGVVIGAILSWYSSFSGKSGFSMIGVVMAAFLPNIATAPSIKLLRTLPWSLNQCAAYVTASYLLPSVVTLATMSAAGCAAHTCSPADGALVWLPIVAVLAPFVAGAVHFGLVGTMTTFAGSQTRKGSMWVYLACVVTLVTVGRFIVPLALAFPLVSNSIAVSIICMAFLWIRHEIAIHTMQQRSPTSIYIGAV